MRFATTERFSSAPADAGPARDHVIALVNVGGLDAELFGIEIDAVRPTRGLSDASMQSLEPQVEDIVAAVRERCA